MLKPKIMLFAAELGLTDLKARALAHIQSSLSTHTVPLEVFSAFSAQFPEIQALQKAYMLANWSACRKSPSMKMVFDSMGPSPSFLASGSNEVDRKSLAFPGFAGVFSELLEHLEYVAPPTPVEVVSSSSNSVAGGGGDAPALA